MAVRNIVRAAAQQGYATPTSAPIRVDNTSNRIFANVAGTGTTEQEIPTVTMAPVPAVAATLAVTAALHAGRTVTLGRAAGIAVTLPAATGTGNKYRFIIQVTFTGAASIKVANATDYMVGVAQMGIDGGTLVPHQYPTANTGTVATESDTIDMFGTANSTGGFKGQIVEIEDIAAAIFFVRVTGDAGGTEATPFSAGV